MNMKEIYKYGNKKKPSEISFRRLLRRERDSNPRVYDPVFHGVVFQFVDDGGTPVDDAERHAVGINCVTIRYDNYG